MGNEYICICICIFSDFDSIYVGWIRLSIINRGVYLSIFNVGGPPMETSTDQSPFIYQNLIKALLALRELNKVYDIEQPKNCEELRIIDDALASANVYPWKLS